MNGERVSAGSENDPTLNPQWLDEEKDRLLSWELFRRHVFRQREPMPPQELADRIGEHRAFVQNVIKSARRKALQSKPEILQNAD